MADFVSHENRVRLFLAFLILVLVIVNSQSLHLSYTSRNLLADSFYQAARAKAELMAAQIESVSSGRTAKPGDEVGGVESLMRHGVEVTRLFETMDGEMTLCLLDWNGRVLAGASECSFSKSLDFDHLDRQGRRLLVEQSWAVTEVAPAYDVDNATVFGYLALRRPDGSDGGVLRLQLPATSLAEANRDFRATLLYQVSAMSLVLLTLVLFLNSLLSPHRKLVAEARSVSQELGPAAVAGDEGQFLVATFQEVVARLKEKEKQLGEMHRLEKARADETQALATDIIRSMTTGLVSLDERGRVVLVNPAAERIFSATAGSLEGKSFADAFPGSNQLEDWVAQAVSQGSQMLRRRVEYRRTEGATIHLGASVLPLQSKEGSVRGVLCLFADLTEVIELRERLFLKENLARLGEMAAGIAHEFRNSLATILGNTKLLAGALSNEREKILVDALAEECSSLSRVVTDFLQFARPEALRPSLFDLASMAQDLCRDLEPVAQEAGVRLTLEADSFRVEADEVLLRKAVSNLVLNGIEAASQQDENGEVRLQTGGQDGRAFVKVTDSGPGVRIEDLPHVFSPFYTTKPQGTGLGLSIVQRIAASHSGAVEVSSEPGPGATFTMTLPARQGRTSLTEEEWV